MEKKYELLCIGTAIVDCIIKGFDPNPVSATGYAASSCSLNAGGEAVNEAMAASKLGAKTGILCHMGRDAAGDMLTSALEKSGACSESIVFSDEHATPVTTMFVNPDGTRKSITNGAHRYNFRPDRYTELIASAKAISLGSLFRAPFDSPEIIHSVVKAASDAGVRVYADTKLPNFARLSLEDIKDSLPYVDCIFPNEDEAKYYTGKTQPEEMADVLLGYGVKSVVIKLGAKGCFFKNAEESYLFPACNITPVDATGAGDNFIAAFICEKLRGESNYSALRFANAVGAICTTAVGASAGLKNRAQVLELLEEN